MYLRQEGFWRKKNGNSVEVWETPALSGFSHWLGGEAVRLPWADSKGLPRSNSYLPELKVERIPARGAKCWACPASFWAARNAYRGCIELLHGFIALAGVGLHLRSIHDPEEASAQFQQTTLLKRSRNESDRWATNPKHQRQERMCELQLLSSTRSCTMRSHRHILCSVPWSR